MQTECIRNQYDVPSCLLAGRSTDASIEKPFDYPGLLQRVISAALTFRSGVQCLLKDGVSATILVSLVIAVGLDITIILCAHTQLESSALTAQLPSSYYRDSRVDDKSGPKRWSTTSEDSIPPAHGVSKHKSSIHSASTNAFGKLSSAKTAPNQAQDGLISANKPEETNALPVSAIITVTNSDSVAAFYTLPTLTCEMPQGIKERGPIGKRRNPLRSFRHGFAKTIGWIHKAFTSDAFVEKTALTDKMAEL